MKFRYVLFTLSLMVFQGVFVFSQQKDNGYNLLWRISGNGISKPSYLFGTIHLKDTRAFHFTDSMWACLDQCEYVALEIHPDSVSNYISDMNNEEEQESRYDYDATPKKRKISNDLWGDDGILSSIRDYKMPKPVLVDGLIYRQGLNTGKKMVGLESVNRQLNTFKHTSKAPEKDPPIFDHYGYDDQDEESEYSTEVEAYIEAEGQESTFEAENIVSPKDSLLVFYERGNIDSLYAYYLKMNVDSNFHNHVLIGRNITMVDTIVKYIKSRSTFIAVGCLHLPGDQGIVQLLRDKGYILTPVTATFDQKSDTSLVPLSKTPFKTVTLLNDASVDFPVSPSQVFVEGTNTFSYQAIDLATGYYYLAGSFPLLLNNTVDKSTDITDFILKTMYTSMGGWQIPTPTDIMIRGNTYREITASLSVGNYLSRAIVKHGVLYYYIVVGIGGNLENHVDVTRFLSSVKFIKQDKRVWNTYTDSKHAFSCSFLNKPIIINDDKNKKSGDYTTKYISIDAKNGVSYALEVKDLDRNGYLQSDSSILSNEFDSFIGSVTSTQQKSKPDSIYVKNGMYTAVWTYTSDPLLNLVHTVKSTCLVRDNRVYTIWGATSTNSYIDSIDAFINSFKLIDPLKESYITQNEDHFSVSVPKGKRTVLTDPSLSKITYSIIHDASLHSDSSNIYSYYSESTGSKYSIKEYFLSKYAYSFNRDSLIEYYKDVDTDDTIVSIDIKSINPSSLLIDLTLKSKKYNNYLIMKVIVQDRLLYVLEHLQSGTPSAGIDPFFKDFKLNTKLQEGNLFASKSKSLLNDVLSNETEIRHNAIKVLKSYSFSKSDVDLLLESSKRSYKDDSLKYKSTRYFLSTKLDGLVDSTYLQRLILAYQDSLYTTEVKYGILTAIASVYSSEASSMLNTIFTKGDVQFTSKTPIYDLKSHLTDYKPHSDALFEYALKSVPNEYSDGHYVTLCIVNNTLLENKNSALVDQKHYKLSISDQSKVYNLCSQILQPSFTSNKYDTKQIAISLLGFIKEDTRSRLLLKKNLKKYEYESLISLIRLNQKVSKKLVNKYASSDRDRIDFKNELTKMGRMDLFPSKYNTYEYTLASVVYGYLYEYDFEDGFKINFVYKENKGSEKVYYFECDYGSNYSKNYVTIQSGDEQKDTIDELYENIKVYSEDLDQDDYDQIVKKVTTHKR